MLAARPQDAPRLSYTDRAMLIIWGQFAQQIGLLDALRTVPLAQKTVDHSPQAKLIELLVATLAGCAHLHDLAGGPNPLVKDHAVAEAWGAGAWADPSGVSRTCQAADAQTVAATVAVLQQISQPFIDREVLLALRQDGVLTYDADLTGREVSPTSRGYPGAAYGWMGDHGGLGYQAAVVSLLSPPDGRILLASRPHPGDTVPGACLEEMVQAAEAATGVRPRRRAELVAARLAALDGELSVQGQRVGRARDRVQAVGADLTASQAELARRAARVAALVAAEPTAREARPERPHGRLAQARARQAVLARRVERRRGALARAEARLRQEEQARTALEQERAAREAHHAALLADNAANPSPVRAIFRLDAGFGSGPNVTWLIEMGYEVYTKAQNAQVTAKLRAAETPATPWQQVGKNAELWVQAGARIRTCPYPIDAAVERFPTGDTLRHATLLHYGEDPVGADPTGWFHADNARQTIEAGIKENKGVFQMRHLKLRSPAGLALAEAFALFAANLVRWAAVWLAEQEAAVPAPFAPGAQTLNITRLVRTAANTSAWITHQPTRGVVVTFTERSPFAGLELAIGGSGGLQLPLPLLKSVQNSPPNTIWSVVAQ